MRLAAGVMVACWIAAGGPALAQKLDVREVKCGEFIKQDKDFHGQMLMWLSAYTMKEDDDPIVDFDRIVAVGTKLGKFCAENPGSGLLAAYESAAK